MRRSVLGAASVIAVLVALALVPPAQRARAGGPEAGIDVSSFQGSINWGGVASSGIAFAYMRAGEGCCTKDQTFQTNWAGAGANGLQRGAYLYFHPGEDPNSQATLLLQQLQSVGFHQSDLIPVIDVETTDGLSQSAVVSALRTLVNDIAASIGVLPAIYTAPSWWDSHVTSSAFTADPLWVANWCGSCAAPTLPAGSWGGLGYQVWQYADNLSVAGISGPVDGDRANTVPPAFPGYVSVTLPQRLSADGMVAGDAVAVSPATGVHAVFWKAPDDHLTGWFSDHGTISHFWGVGLPANMASDPSVVALPDGGFDVFWRSTTSELWMVSSAEGYAARDLGIANVAATPHAAASADGAVTIAWTRSDETLWLTTVTSQATAVPYSISGAMNVLATAPVYYGAGALAVFWRAAGGSLWWDANTGTGWAPPVNLGHGPLASDPQPISPAAGVIDVFWLGTDGIIWDQAYDGNWRSPAAVSGANMSSTPAIVPTAGGFTVFVRDPQSAIWVSAFSSAAGWTPPTLVGAGAAGSLLSAIPQGSPGHYEVYLAGTDGALYQLSF